MELTEQTYLKSAPVAVGNYSNSCRLDTNVHTEIFTIFRILPGAKLILINTNIPE